MSDQKREEVAPATSCVSAHADAPVPGGTTFAVGLPERPVAERTPGAPSGDAAAETAPERYHHC